MGAVAGDGELARVLGAQVPGGRGAGDALGLDLLLQPGEPVEQRGIVIQFTR